MTEVRHDPTAELRSKLLRRLAWKVPIILLLVSLAVWWQWRKDSERNSNSGVSARVGAAFTGSWSGEVTYSWGERFREEFFFQPENGKLFGSASFLGAKRGIEDGSGEGENISFFVRFHEVSGEKTTERKNTYWGKLTGEKDSDAATRRPRQSAGGVCFEQEPRRVPINREQSRVKFISEKESFGLSYIPLGCFCAAKDGKLLTHRLVKFRVNLACERRCNWDVLICKENW
jgi:hypothetical protein